MRHGHKASLCIPIRQPRRCDEQVNPVILRVRLRHHDQLVLPLVRIRTRVIDVQHRRVTKVEPQRIRAEVPARGVAVRQLRTFVLREAGLEGGGCFCNEGLVLECMGCEGLMV